MNGMQGISAKRFEVRTKPKHSMEILPDHFLHMDIVEILGIG
jgi:hypothetical protein